jgi:hypothetical protein
MSTSAHLTLTAEDKTHAAFRSLNQNIHGTLESLGGLKNKLLAVAAVAGFWKIIEPAIEAGAEIEKLSKTLGASTESLSQFRHVAEVAHVSFESLTKGWRLMEKNVSLAAIGTGAAKDALKALGISATELKNLKPEEQFEVLSDAMVQVQNPADRVRLAMQIFGRAGAELIPIMEGGSKAIQAARIEADKLGLTLNETSAHQLAEAHEAMVRLKSAFQGAANTLAITFGPAIAAMAEGLSLILPKAANLTVTAFIRAQEAIALALSTILVVLNKVFSVFGKLPGSVGKLFREAADAADMFTKKLLTTVMGCEKALDSMTAQQQAYHQSLAKTGQTFHTVYHPALQAMTAQHQRAEGHLKMLNDAEKSYQTTLEAGKHLSQEMRTPQEIYRDHLKDINQLLQAGAINHQTYSRAIKQYQNALSDANGVSSIIADQKKQVEDHVKTIANIFRNGLFSFLEDGFKGMVKSFENALSAMAADAAASEISRFLFGSVANSALKGSSGLLGQFLNDGFGKLFGFGSFGGFRAQGGSVLAGHSYLVGERGREVFTPQQSGTIISNDQLNKNNSVPSIVMNIHTPDANSFRLSRGQITAEMGLALQRALHRNT